jgi:hypothetical protein
MPRAQDALERPTCSELQMRRASLDARLFISDVGEEQQLFTVARGSEHASHERAVTRGTFPARGS